MSHDRRLRRDRLPLVLSVAALVIAIFGATPLGEAALRALPLSSVGTAQLKANAVTSAKVKNGTLLRADFASGVIPASSAGPKGDPGPKGDKGDKGEKGDPGPRTPVWGSADGPGSGIDYSAWRETGAKLTLARIAGGRYFVFGRIDADIRCGSAACGESYALMLNGVFVPQTNVSFSGPPNQRTKQQFTVFGVAPSGTRGTPLSNPVLTVRYLSSGTPTTSSIAVSLGAIALG